MPWSALRRLSQTQRAKQGHSAAVLNVARGLEKFQAAQEAELVSVLPHLNRQAEADLGRMCHQGDPQYYEPEELEKRFALRSHLAVLVALSEWWRCVHTIDGEDGVSEEEYKFVMEKVYRALIDTEDYEDEDAKDSVAEDWKRDSRGMSILSRDAFFDSLFELADLWTDSTTASDYVNFLLDLLNSITYYNGFERSFVEIDQISPGCGLPNEGKTVDSNQPILGHLSYDQSISKTEARPILGHPSYDQSISKTEVTSQGSSASMPAQVGTIPARVGTMPTQIEAIRAEFAPSTQNPKSPPIRIRIPTQSIHPIPKQMNMIGQPPKLSQNRLDRIPLGARSDAEETVTLTNFCALTKPEAFSFSESRIRSKNDTKISNASHKKWTALAMSNRIARPGYSGSALRASVQPEASMRLPKSDQEIQREARIAAWHRARRELHRIDTEMERAMLECRFNLERKRHVNTMEGQFSDSILTEQSVSKLLGDLRSSVAGKCDEVNQRVESLRASRQGYEDTVELPEFRKIMGSHSTRASRRAQLCNGPSSHHLIDDFKSVVQESGRKFRTPAAPILALGPCDRPRIHTGPESHLEGHSSSCARRMEYGASPFDISRRRTLNHSASLPAILPASISIAASDASTEVGRDARLQMKERERIYQELPPARWTIESVVSARSQNIRMRYKKNSLNSRYDSSLGIMCGGQFAKDFLPTVTKYLRVYILALVSSTDARTCRLIIQGGSCDVKFSILHYF